MSFADDSLGNRVLDDSSNEHCMDSVDIAVTATVANSQTEDCSDASQTISVTTEEHVGNTSCQLQSANEEVSAKPPVSQANSLEAMECIETVAPVVARKDATTSQIQAAMLDDVVVPVSQSDNISLQPVDVSTSDSSDIKCTSDATHCETTTTGSLTTSDADGISKADDAATEILTSGDAMVRISTAGSANARELSNETEPSIYHVKWIKFRGLSTAIVMQNQNGPCPLLAVVNVLLLQTKIKLTAGSELVAADQLIAYIADYIFDNVPKHISDATRLNYEQNMNDAILVFPRLQTGLDVNVKFTGVHDFEYTPECIVFDLLDIPLVHGWLIDPEMKRVAEALGSCSYNQLVEKIIENKNSDKEELVTSALIAEEFLNSTASQLTYHGLCELSSTLADEQLCILFRNNHFSTLYKRKTELFVLVTDQGFLNEANVVWETLSNVEGDGHFVDVNFHTYQRRPETAASRVSAAAQPLAVNSKEQIDQDYLVALSLEQDAHVTASDVWMDDEDVANLSDHDLAVKLQRQEELKAGTSASLDAAQSSGSGLSLHRQQKTASSATGTATEEGGASGGKEKKPDNCIVL